MGLLNQTQQQYYSGNNFGGYQFTSINDIIDNFMATYVGEGKILSKTNRADVSFHAHRALQELSFDTFKSCKMLEMEILPNLTMLLPQDYVNYVKLSWSDDSGIEHVIYPTSKTSNPKKLNPTNANYFDSEYQQQTFYIEARGTVTNNSTALVLDDEYKNIIVGMVITSATTTWGINTHTVEAVSTVNGITTVTMDNPATANMTSLFLPVEFRMSDDSAIIPLDNTNVVNVGEIGAAGFPQRITLFNTIDSGVDSNVSSLKPGDFISSQHFPLGTQIDEIIWDGSSNSGFITTTDAATATVNNTSDPDLQITFYRLDTLDSTTWNNYKSHKPAENNINDYQDYQNDTYWPNEGRRYGLDPQHSQVNGSYYIDCREGKIHFSSNLSGKTVILEYISDSLGTDDEMQVHKLAEEAIYKWIAYGCLAARIDVPEYVVRRYKKERFAETRKAKLRLSNIKLEEITQILRGKSKQIKH